MVTDSPKHRVGIDDLRDKHTNLNGCILGAVGEGCSGSFGQFCLIGRLRVQRQLGSLTVTSGLPVTRPLADEALANESDWPISGFTTGGIGLCLRQTSTVFQSSGAD
jgi:hypothetical protein